MEYKEQLKDPRWQKKRLEILKRDEFCCQTCSNNESELHVHHITYVSGKEIWDYENKYLITLCENCHNVMHSLKIRNRYIVDIFTINGDFSKELNIILELLLHFLNKWDMTSIAEVRNFCNNLKNKEK